MGLAFWTTALGQIPMHHFSLLLLSLPGNLLSRPTRITWEQTGIHRFPCRCQKTTAPHWVAKLVTEELGVQVPSQTWSFQHQERSLPPAHPLVPDLSNWGAHAPFAEHSRRKWLAGKSAVLLLCLLHLANFLEWSLINHTCSLSHVAMDSKHSYMSVFQQASPVLLYTQRNATEFLFLAIPWVFVILVYFGAKKIGTQACVHNSCFL